MNLLSSTSLLSLFPFIILHCSTSTTLLLAEARSTESRSTARSATTSRWSDYCFVQPSCCGFISTANNILLTSHSAIIQRSKIQNKKTPFALTSTFNVYPFPKSSTSSNSYKCELRMGVRSFFRNSVSKIKNKGASTEKEQNPSNVKKALEAIQADLKAFNEKEVNVTSKPKKKSSPRTPSSSSFKPPYGETMKQRIDRMHSGSMTEEEKTNFLKRVISPRQRNDDEEKENSVSTAQTTPTPNSLSPVTSSRGRSGSTTASKPQENALWSVIGKTNQSSSSSSSSMDRKGGDMSDDAKKKYLEMVTNPKRFKSYASVGEMDDGRKNNTLASRLEEDAVTREREDAETKARRDLERNAEIQRLAEIQRQRDEEQMIIEEERLERERIQRENQERVEEEQRRVDKERMEQMVAAQEAYWKEKLAEEEVVAMENNELEEIKEGVMEEREENVVLEYTDNQVQDTPNLTSEFTSLPSLSSPPSDGPIATRLPQPIASGEEDDDDSVSPFIREQQRQLVELTKLRNREREKLESLNSPIPTPSNTPPQSPQPAVMTMNKKLPTAAELLSLGKINTWKKLDDVTERDVGDDPKEFDDVGKALTVGEQKEKQREVIRTQIPLGDEDTTRSSFSSDIFKIKGEKKDRAKSWGIDIDKISKG